MEIDLITIDATGIHFVEVKSRTAPVMAPPQENVGYLKQKRLTAAAQRWLHSARDPRKHLYRFSVHYTGSSSAEGDEPGKGLYMLSFFNTPKLCLMISYFLK